MARNRKRRAVDDDDRYGTYVSPDEPQAETEDEDLGEALDAALADEDEAPEPPPRRRRRREWSEEESDAAERDRQEQAQAELQAKREAAQREQAEIHRQHGGAVVPEDPQEREEFLHGKDDQWDPTPTPAQEPRREEQLDIEQQAQRMADKFLREAEVNAEKSRAYTSALHEAKLRGQRQAGLSAGNQGTQAVNAPQQSAPYLVDEELISSLQQFRTLTMDEVEEFLGDLEGLLNARRRAINPRQRKHLTLLVLLRLQEYQ